MARSGVMVIVRIGVRKSEIARISGIGRWRQGAADLHFKEGRVRWKKGSESLYARLEVQLFVSWDSW